MNFSQTDTFQKVTEGIPEYGAALANALEAPTAKRDIKAFVEAHEPLRDLPGGEIDRLAAADKELLKEVIAK